MIDCVNLWQMDRNYPLYRNSEKMFACVYALISHYTRDTGIEIQMTWYVLVDGSGNMFLYDDESDELFALDGDDDPEDMMRRTGVCGDSISVGTMPELDTLGPPPGWDMYDRESGVWLDYMQALFHAIEKGNRMIEEMELLEKGKNPGGACCLKGR